MNIDSPVSRHHPLGHSWCPASPSWDQLLSKKGKQIYFLLFQEIDVVVVECWFMFQPNIYISGSLTAAGTNRLSDLQIHVPDTQKPCPEQLGSWQSTEKRKMFQKTCFSYFSWSAEKSPSFRKGQTLLYFFGQYWTRREMFCQMGTLRWVIRTSRRPRTE